MRTAPEWPNPDYLADHFAWHRWDTGAQTIEEYGASAQATIERGERFEYLDPDKGRPRVGYWDAETQLFTALSPDETVLVTHFGPDDPDYPTSLPGTTYRA